MRKEQQKYRAGDEAGQKGGGVIGLLMASLLLAMMFVAACNDQPLDPITSRIDTTIVTHRDTVVVNSHDTIFETRVDTVIVERRDTLEVTTVKRDTIRDTVKVEVIKTRIDTIEVPVNVVRLRRGILRFQGRNDSLGANGAVETLEFNLTEWLQYRVIDSGGVVRGIGLSLSAALPPLYANYSIGSAQVTAENLYRLRGISIFIPTFRVNPINGVFNDVPLDQHPFDYLSADGEKGGIMITTRRRVGTDLQQFWTGQVLDNSPTGGERYVNQGTFLVKSINTTTKIITTRIEAGFFLPVDVSGRTVAQPFQFALDLDLGY
ncbi:MAG: hypothetical protein AB7H80_04660 [Candidatus Kapaibacterium sp.]